MGVLLSFLPTRPALDPDNTIIKVLRPSSGFFLLPLIAASYNPRFLSASSSTFTVTETAPSVTILSNGTSDWLFLDIEGSLTSASSLTMRSWSALIKDSYRDRVPEFFDVIYYTDTSSQTVPLVGKFFTSQPYVDNGQVLHVAFQAVLPRITASSTVFSVVLRANSRFASWYNRCYSWSSFTYTVVVGFF